MSEYKKIPGKSKELAEEFRKWLTVKRPCYHTIDTLEDGTVIGGLGAFRWILDDEGNPLSYAFHEIVPDNKGYAGRIGANTYRLRKNGELYRRKLDKRRNEDITLTDFNIHGYLTPFGTKS